MNRRNVIAGIGSLAVLGVGGAAVLGTRGSNATETLEPITIQPLDVPSSPEAPFRIPFENRVTVIDLFATWCKPCMDHMGTLRATKSAVEDSVRFVSVTNEAVGDEQGKNYVTKWWADHGGNWAAGFDDGGKLTRRMNVDGLPFTAIVNRDGQVTWTATGTPSKETVVDRVQRVTND